MKRSLTTIKRFAIKIKSLLSAFCGILGKSKTFEFDKMGLTGPNVFVGPEKPPLQWKNRREDKAMIRADIKRVVLGFASATRQASDRFQSNPPYRFE